MSNKQITTEPQHLWFRQGGTVRAIDFNGLKQLSTLDDGFEPYLKNTPRDKEFYTFDLTMRMASNTIERYASNVQFTLPDTPDSLIQSIENHIYQDIHHACDYALERYDIDYAYDNAIFINNACFGYHKDPYLVDLEVGCENSENTFAAELSLEDRILDATNEILCFFQENKELSDFFFILPGSARYITDQIHRSYSLEI
jgi:hypothetical protein